VVLVIEDHEPLAAVGAGEAQDDPHITHRPHSAAAAVQEAAAPDEVLVRLRAVEALHNHRAAMPHRECWAPVRHALGAAPPLPAPPGRMSSLAPSICPDAASQEPRLTTHVLYPTRESILVLSGGRRSHCGVFYISMPPEYPFTIAHLSRSTAELYRTHW
jgi:hypothetical protein